MSTTAYCKAGDCFYGNLYTIIFTSSSGSFSVAGYNNRICGAKGVVIRGNNNTVEEAESVTVSGNDNEIQKAKHVTISGSGNTVWKAESVSISGNENTILEAESVSISGNCNVVSQAEHIACTGMQNRGKCTSATNSGTNNVFDTPPGMNAVDQRFLISHPPLSSQHASSFSIPTTPSARSTYTVTHYGSGVVAAMNGQALNEPGPISFQDGHGGMATFNGPVLASFCSSSGPHTHESNGCGGGHVFLPSSVQHFNSNQANVARTDATRFVQPNLSQFEDTRLVDDTDQSNLCCICLLNEKRIALVPCGHVCLCGSCTRAYTTSEASKPNGVTCPICKTVANTAIIVYK